MVLSIGGRIIGATRRASPGREYVLASEAVGVSAASGHPTGPASGDLELNYPGPRVRAVQGRAWTEDAPRDMQTPAWIHDQTEIQWVTLNTVVPMLTDFHLNAPTHVTPGTDLSNQQIEYDYTLVHANNVRLMRMILQRITPSAAPVTLVADAPRVEGANSGDFNFPDSVPLANAGDEVRFTLQGYSTSTATGTPIVTASRDLLVRTAPRPDVIYFGTQVSTESTEELEPADVTIADLSTSTRTSGNYTIPAFTGANRHVIYAYPSSLADITGIRFGGGLNQIEGFDPNPAARQIDSINYDWYISNQALVPSIVSGQTMSITRG